MSVCLLLTISGATLDSDFEAFRTWKLKYQKSYSNAALEQARFANFQNNLRFIESHAATTYTVALNKFADLTAKEFAHLYHKTQISLEGRSAPPSNVEPSAVTPKSWDWRSKGAVGPVENEGEEGDVSAIVTADALNSAIAVQKKQSWNNSCSVANLVDCVQMQSLDATFQYAVSHGVDTTASYPTEKGTCSFNPKTLCTKLTGFINMTNEVQATTILYQSGPLAASFDAGQSSFQFYSGGIYSNQCHPVTLDHALLLVGYNSLNSKPYWIAKNSWGEDWGVQGYAYISRGQNLCGIMSNTLSATLPK